jgi:CBS domain-containing protein
MKEKQVKDLMLSLDEYATISADSTIRDALIALDEAQLGLDDDRHHHRAVLVLDEKGRVAGKLSHWAIMRRLEPKFLKTQDLVRISQAGLTKEFIESLEAQFSGFTNTLALMCAEAAKTKARDAMVPVNESIDEEASIADAVHELVIHHVQSMVVTRDGEVVGILRLSDVFQEVAHLIRDAPPGRTC